MLILSSLVLLPALPSPTSRCVHIIHLQFEWGTSCIPRTTGLTGILALHKSTKEFVSVILVYSVAIYICTWWVASRITAVDTGRYVCTILENTLHNLTYYMTALLQLECITMFTQFRRQQPSTQKAPRGI